MRKAELQRNIAQCQLRSNRTSQIGQTFQSFDVTRTGEVGGPPIISGKVSLVIKVIRETSLIEGRPHNDANVQFLTQR